MRTRSILVWGGALLILGVGAACTTDYQQGKDDPSYGGPNALAGQRPPGPTLDQSDAGPTGSTPNCVSSGGTVVDAGTCDVSFSKDVLGAFKTANCATTSCHGGTTPPKIDTADGPGTWQVFQAFNISVGKAYINPCSKDTSASAIGCNLLAEGQAGACGVHMPIGAQIPQAALDKINAWSKCGSPNN